MFIHETMIRECAKGDLFRADLLATLRHKLTEPLPRSIFDIHTYYSNGARKEYNAEDNDQAHLFVEMKSRHLIDVFSS